MEKITSFAFYNIDYSTVYTQHTAIIATLPIFMMSLP